MTRSLRCAPRSGTVVPTLLLSTLFAACLPDRFRDGDSAIDSGADRSDIDATSADSADTSAPQDGADASDASMDVPADNATVSDAADVFSADTMNDATDDAREAGADGGACAPCTANEACVAGACVARNCQGVRERIVMMGGSTADTTTMIDPDGAGPESAFSVHCADLATTPKEYIAVPPATNRRVNVNEGGCDNWTTEWSRVRLLIDTSGARPAYAVDAADFRFTNDIANAACRSSAGFQAVRVTQPNSVGRRLWGVAESCTFSGFNNYAQVDLLGTGFRFPAERFRRYKFETYSAVQAGLFVVPQSAYSYRVAAEAMCGAAVPYEFDRVSDGLPAYGMDTGYPPEFIATFRVPIERASTLAADPAPGSSCESPLPVNPIGWDISQSGVVTTFFGRFTSRAPTGAMCAPSGSPEALWIRVEVPAMTRRRLTAVSSTAADTAGLRVVDRCDGTCSLVNTTVGLPGRTSVMLDNSTGATARTFVIAVNANNASSITDLGNPRVSFFTQTVEPASCFSVTVPNAGTTLVPPSQDAPVDGFVASGRRVTFRTTLAQCATGSILEYCQNPTCTMSLCGSIPCRIDVPAATPEFTVSFPQAGRYYWRMKSVRRWMPAVSPETEYDPIPVGNPGPMRAIDVP